MFYILVLRLFVWRSKNNHNEIGPKASLMTMIGVLNKIIIKCLIIRATENFDDNATHSPLSKD